MEGELGRLAMDEPTARESAGAIFGEEDEPAICAWEKRLVAPLPKEVAKGEADVLNGLEPQTLLDADALEVLLVIAAFSALLPAWLLLMLFPPPTVASERGHRLGDALGLGVPITPTLGL